MHINWPSRVSGGMDKITSADRCIRRRQLGAIILGQTKMCVDVCRLCLAFRNSSIQRLKTDSILLKILQDIFHCTKRASWTKCESMNHNSSIHIALRDGCHTFFLILWRNESSASSDAGRYRTNKRISNPSTAIPIAYRRWGECWMKSSSSLWGIGQLPDECCFSCLQSVTTNFVKQASVHTGGL